MNLISVIVTTYNWPEVLDRCLASLIAQEDSHFEIIIADDGSTHETLSVIKQYIQNSTISIKHAFHSDKGFRAGTIRNKAVALSLGTYLVFIDGDCVVFPHFVKRHRALAEKSYFVPGNRILLSKDYTQVALTARLSLHSKSVLFFVRLWLSRKINRILPLFYIPFSLFRYTKPLEWKKAMTCNLALFRSDFIAVNGFDEAFEGWGFEDSDLVIRLIHNGVKRKEGRFLSPVLHHWHRQNDQANHDENYQRLMVRVENGTLIQAQKGMNQYL